MNYDDRMSVARIRMHYAVGVACQAALSEIARERAIAQNAIDERVAFWIKSNAQQLRRYRQTRMKL